MGEIEELGLELKAAKKEIGRLQPLEQRVRDLINDLRRSRADLDRCCSSFVLYTVRISKMF